MTTVIWSTESVDTSAMLLAQALDDVVFTKDAELRDEELKVIASDLENHIIFYGAVNIPEWFIRDGNLNNDRVFNSPTVTKKFSNRNTVAETLSLHNINTLIYKKINAETSYNSLKEVLGQKFDLVVKNGMNVIDTVKNREEYLQKRVGAYYACKHLDAVMKIRLFCGLPDLTDEGLIGILVSEKRMLSFLEMLTYGSSADVKHHIEQMFLDGHLTEAMGEGKTKEAWTEIKFIGSKQIEENLKIKLKNIAAVLQTIFGVVGKPDFLAVDIVQTANGELYVTNTTTSPSLTNDNVLQSTASYFDSLIKEGRKMTKERFFKIVQNLTDEQVISAAKLLKQEGLLVTSRV